MEFDFLQPLDGELLQFVEVLSPQQLGSKIALHAHKDFPDLCRVKIVLLGVLENRGNGTEAEKVNVSHFRKEFYSLFPGNWHVEIADLGNIVQGDTISDTYYALEKITATLIKRKIIPIVIGGSQDLTYALYRAYDNLEQMVNLVAIDSRFDFGKEVQELRANSYLTKIIIEEPNNLFNYSNVGFQTYFNAQEEIDLIEKLFFDAYRLGEISIRSKSSKITGITRFYRC